MNRGSPVPEVPALILGHDIAPLGVLRALAAHRVDCLVVEETTDVISHSRWYRSPQRTLAETDDGEALTAYLRSLEIDRAVLLPCSDRWVLAVAGMSDDLERRFPSGSPGRDVVEQLVDKDRFGALVARLGIPHPFTLDIGGPADLGALSDEQLASGFLKPTSSVLHRRHFGTKGSFVTSRAAAVQRVKEAAALGIGFVFQDWIPGPHASSILIDGLVDRHGDIHGLTARRKIREYPARLGTTSASIGIRPASVSDAVESVTRLLAEISYRGLFNIEFKHDARDGLHKIIEFNPRACWYTGTIVSGGVDLPWLAYHDALEMPVPSTGRYRAGRRALYEFGDARAILVAVREGRRPEGSVVRTWLLGDRALFWWRDPLPALGGVLAVLRRRIRRFFARN